MAEIQLIDPKDGKVVRADAKDAANLYQAGFKDAVDNQQAIRQQEGLESTGSMFQTAAEGLARGASFSTSDLALRKLYDKPEEIEQRQAANPTTAKASEVAGAILAGLGITVATGGAAAGAGVGLVGRLAGQGIISAEMAAASSLGSTLNQADLGNIALKGEHVTAAAVMDVLKEPLKDAGKAAALGFGLGAAGEALVSGVGAAARSLKGGQGKLAEFAKRQELARLNPTIRQREVLERKGLLDKVIEYSRQTDTLGKDLSKAREVVKADINKTGKYLEDTYSKLDSYTRADVPLDVRLTGAGPNKASILQRIEKEILPLAENDVQATTWLPIVKRNLKTLGSRESISFNDLQQLRRSLDSAKPRALRQMRGILADELDSAAERTLQKLGGESELVAFRAARERYGTAKEMEKLVGRTRSVGIGQGIDIAKDTGYVGLAANMAGISNPAVMATYGVSRLTSELAKRGQFAGLARDLSEVRFINSFSKFAEGKLRTGVQGLVRGAAIAGGMNLGELTYEDVAPKLEELANYPNTVNQRVQRSLDGAPVPPEVQDAAIVRSQLAVKFLAGKLPKAPYAPSLVTQRQWKPPEYMKRQFMRYVQAIQDPSEVLRNPTVQGIEALKEVYPETYFAAVQAAQQEIGNNKQLPYSVQLKLARIFGTGTIPSTQPAFIANMQKSYQREEGEQQPARQRKAQRMKIQGLATGQASESQRLATRD